MVTLLVKSSLASRPAAVPAPSEGAAATVASQPIPLRREDLQAFLNRVFLEDAIAFCTVEMSSALQQVL